MIDLFPLLYPVFHAKMTAKQQRLVHVLFRNKTSIVIHHPVAVFCLLIPIYLAKVASSPVLVVVVHRILPSLLRVVAEAWALFGCTVLQVRSDSLVHVCGDLDLPWQPTLTWMDHISGLIASQNKLIALISLTRSSCNYCLQSGKMILFECEWAVVK